MPDEAFNPSSPLSLDKDAARLKAWQSGLTGYPIVDAGMRELWKTGFMHNRVRMVVASFLTKHLLINWREGEAWFWDCLLDADLASNACSWQWVGGSGADAATFAYSIPSLRVRSLTKLEAIRVAGSPRWQACRISTCTSRGGARERSVRAGVTLAKITRGPSLTTKPRAAAPQHTAPSNRWNNPPGYTRHDSYRRVQPADAPRILWGNS